MPTSGAWTTLYRHTGVGAAAWLLALAVAAGGIALSHAVGDPQPFCEGITHRGCLTGYGWASAIYLGTSLGVAIGAGHLGRYRRLRGTSVSPAGEVASGDAFEGESGPVAVEGRVVPATEPVEAPVSGEPAVWYRSATEREHELLPRGRIEADSETDAVDFYVEDGSGRVLVRATDLDPHDAASLLRSATEDGGGAGGDGDAERRREWRLEPDDAVTVVGRATEVSRAEYPEAVVLGLEGRTIVGRRTLGELRGWAAQRAVGGAAIALVVGGASLAAMLAFA